MEPPLDESVAQPTGCGASVPETGMSMADDNTLRPYRSSDPYRGGAEPGRPSQEASARDPLAELARLLGQSDPFADFGRSNSRQGQQEAHDAPATAPDDWQSAPAREPQFAVGGAQDRWAQGSSQGSSQAPRAQASSKGPTQGSSPESSQESSRDYHSPAAQSEADSRFYDELHVGADQQTQYYDDNRTDDGQHDAQEAEAEYYYQDDDVPLDPHENAMYDDAPRARRGGGLVTALALTGCAVFGTAGAYAYRSYFSNPSPTQPPPVITADNPTPTKIVPASAGDPQSINVAQDRSANPDKEQIVS